MPTAPPAAALAVTHGSLNKGACVVYRGGPGPGFGGKIIKQMNPLKEMRSLVKYLFRFFSGAKQRNKTRAQGHRFHLMLYLRTCDRRCKGMGKAVNYIAVKNLLFSNTAFIFLSSLFPQFCLVLLSFICR